MSCAGRNDIAASMAASQEQDEPDAVGSAIVSTPLGKMTKAVSPIKKLPLRPPSNLRMAPTGLPGAGCPREMCCWRVPSQPGSVLSSGQLHDLFVKHLRMSPSYA